MKGNNNNPPFCVLIRQKSQRVLLTAALIFLLSVLLESLERDVFNLIAPLPELSPLL